MRWARNFPAIQDIQKHVVDKGLSKAPKDKVGELLYNRGIYNSMLIAEGIAQAQKLTGKKAVTGEDVRRGMENIKLDPARLKELGLEGFTDSRSTLLRRPQRPPRRLHAGMGRHEMGEDLRTPSSR